MITILEIKMFGYNDDDLNSLRGSMLLETVYFISYNSSVQYKSVREFHTHITLLIFENEFRFLTHCSNNECTKISFVYKMFILYKYSYYVIIIT